MHTRRHSAITATRYFDEVVDQLHRAGIEVSTMIIDMPAAEPM